MNQKVIIQKNKLYRKKKQDTKYVGHYKLTKTKLQKEMKNSYWNYIKNMIYDMEPDINSFFSKQPKKLYSYFKSQKTENTDISHLRSEDTLHTNPIEKAI